MNKKVLCQILRYFRKDNTINNEVQDDPPIFIEVKKPFERAIRRNTNDNVPIQIVRPIIRQSNIIPVNIVESVPENVEIIEISSSPSSESDDNVNDPTWTPRSRRTITRRRRINRRGRQRRFRS
ncbi:hypothetical protein CDAR_66731 [Caerostris darwini]|uniref:Uncharacterized protein n=1 Tax=Caerostris darwini TaxID=1538125 RepID=A0AAV4T6K8_9ARAC|nr:hypothetical protein CDAR_66731 [Caerostris darwini]